jgi:hypothetical protein
MVFLSRYYFLMTLVTCISSLTFLFFVKDKHGVFHVVPDTFFRLEAIQKTGGFSSVRHSIHWTRGLFLFVSMTLFVFFAGDTHLLRTIAALRDEDVVINPRTRSKSGFFVKAPVWKPVSFFPLPSALITRMLVIVDAVQEWGDLLGGVWYIDVDDSTPAGAELSLLLANYWQIFRDEIRAATSSRCGATLALSSQSLPSYCCSFSSPLSDREGKKVAVLTAKPKYKRVILYNEKAYMAPHTDQHHVVGAVSCVLRVGKKDAQKGLYTCSSLGRGSKRIYCKEKIGAAFCVPRGVCHGVGRGRSTNRVVLAVGW